MRRDGRGPHELRPVRVELDFTANPLASVLFEMGRTKVLCTVHEERSVPRFLQGSGRGWITAEYSLLPGSTERRTDREASRGRPSGRTQEIQRLIGRSLRAVADLPALGERSLWVDCDVLEADGGTRTASITGGYVPLHLAFQHLRDIRAAAKMPLSDQVAGVSCGLLRGVPVLDLDYTEDSTAQADANFVLTGSGGIVEIQGTAEQAPFDEAAFLAMLALARSGTAELIAHQRAALGL